MSMVYRSASLLSKYFSALSARAKRSLCVSE